MENAQAENQTDTLTRDSKEYLSFVVGGEGYAIAIASVREIRGWTDPSSMPDADPCFMGVINLRGEMLPLLDLAAKLGLKTPQINERSVIIVVEIGQNAIGLLVDSVSNIIAPPAEEMKEPPESAKNAASNFVSALTLVDEKLVRILDLAAIVPDEVLDAA
ncbi:chemotaxis protein CheW [Roseobacter sinensis]|uniref:Chemotaxis protein CheW n=1 Tax=Roseobacter sinensis TaxID=2931391 RepID=A0ABT3BD56_9RHOB|nr:chemotaxis protein CheW [Roseobacter sp. WL0113]MCV3271511.1 chemotaxis protein CheW [Roseobacter sp. WL0113]